MPQQKQPHPVGGLDTPAGGRAPEAELLGQRSVGRPTDDPANVAGTERSAEAQARPGRPVGAATQERRAARCPRLQLPALAHSGEDFAFVWTYRLAMALKGVLDGFIDEIG